MLGGTYFFGWVYIILKKERNRWLVLSCLTNSCVKEINICFFLLVIWTLVSSFEGVSPNSWRKWLTFTHTIILCRRHVEREIRWKKKSYSCTLIHARIKIGRVCFTLLRLNIITFVFTLTWANKISLFCSASLFSKQKYNWVCFWKDIDSVWCTYS